METTVAPLDIQKPVRNLLPADFTPTDVAVLEPWYQQLESAAIQSVDDLRTWMRQVDELQSVLQEDLGRRYIRMTCNTQDDDAVQAYQYFVEHISPYTTRRDQALTRKFYDSPFRQQLTGPEYDIVSRLAAKDIELFREENVDLQSQIDLKAQQYGAISGAMTIEHEGQTLTLQQAGKLLESTDRSLRETIWRKIAARRAQDRDRLDDLFDELLVLRHKVAVNAGFASFTDYMFQALGRFDYTRADCLAFHDAIEKAVVPLCDEINENRRQRLGLSALMPWDTAVDPFGTEPLHPFATDKELLDRSITLFQHLRPELGSMVRTLDVMGHLDLGSRIGKAPGGYNYPLNETGVPFIFMNAVGTQSDLTTMVHECGHAFHSFVTRDLALSAWKNVPSEVAELASMSMELVSMQHWNLFYTNPAELRRAQIQQILRSITILPWIAVVDAFQTWLYDNPTHTRQQRRDKWTELHIRFFGHSVSWAGLEEDRSWLWHRQLHIFEVPFYYIEYGMAQLGALQVWRRSTENHQQALEDYLKALRLGYTRPIGEVYAAAGVRFDFSADMLRTLTGFVRQQLNALGFFAVN